MSGRGGRVGSRAIGASTHLRHDLLPGVFLDLRDDDLAVRPFERETAILGESLLDFREVVLETGPVRFGVRDHGLGLSAGLRHQTVLLITLLNGLDALVYLAKSPFDELLGLVGRVESGSGFLDQDVGEGPSSVVSTRSGGTGLGRGFRFQVSVFPELPGEKVIRPPRVYIQPASELSGLLDFLRRFVAFRPPEPVVLVVDFLETVVVNGARRRLIG